jgi:hypothetical protein
MLLCDPEPLCVPEDDCAKAANAPPATNAVVRIRILTDFIGKLLSMSPSASQFQRRADVPMRACEIAQRAIADTR